MTMFRNRCSGSYSWGRIRGAYWSISNLTATNEVWNGSLEHWGLLPLSLGRSTQTLHPKLLALYVDGIFVRPSIDGRVRRGFTSLSKSSTSGAHIDPCSF